jgi:hypothetical protein
MRNRRGRLGEECLQWLRGPGRLREEQPLGRLADGRHGEFAADFATRRTLPAHMHASS